MSLLEMQQLFAKLIGQLLVWIDEQGWQITLAEGYNGEGVGHMPNSLHYQRLAQDLNLFVNGVWQQTDGPEWQKIGAYWEGLHDLCRWGGRFAKLDLDHFSLAYQGRA